MKIPKLKGYNVPDGYCLCDEAEVDAANEMLASAKIVKAYTPEEALEYLRKKYLDELSVDDVDMIDRTLGKSLS